ncbi:MAG: UPF0175 family protein [Candidatus Desantisbacteria bacterium]
MTTVTIEIPTELTKQFSSTDEIRRTVYEDFIIEQRQRGNISLGKAAEMLGITYTEFFGLLGKKGLSFINATHDELDKSYRQVKRVMEDVGI